MNLLQREFADFLGGLAQETLLNSQLLVSRPTRNNLSDFLLRQDVSDSSTCASEALVGGSGGQRAILGFGVDGP